MSRQFAEGIDHGLFLYDMESAVEVIRGAIVDAIGPYTFEPMYMRLFEYAIDYVFQGRISMAERHIEKQLMHHGVAHYNAIIASRKVFERIFEIFEVDNEAAFTGANYDYRIYHDERQVSVMKSNRNKVKGFNFLTRSETNVETMIAEIQQTIDEGGYVPDRMRRILDEHRRH
jgi:hypothetical protein